MPKLVKLHPTSAALNVATNVTITGHSFAPSSSLTVRFSTLTTTEKGWVERSRRSSDEVSTLDVHAWVLTPRTVLATISAHSGLPVGPLTATISQDGLVYDTNVLQFSASIGNSQPASYCQPIWQFSLVCVLGLPLDTALRPSSGLLVGGYQVVLEGDSLGSGTQYAIMFGDKPHRVYTRCGRRIDPAGLAAVEVMEETCAGARDTMEHVCTSADPGECALWCQNDDETAKQLALDAVPTVIACNMPNTVRFGMKAGPAAVTMTANGKDWVDLSQPFVFDDTPNPCGYTCTHTASAKQVFPALGLIVLSLLCSWMVHF